MHKLELKNVSIKRGNLTIGLFNFTFKENESILIYGPNGYGKTTLLLAIAGIIKYEGDIFLDEKPVKNYALEKRGITYAPAKPTLINRISVLDNLKISGNSAVEIAVEMGLKSYFGQKAYTLSDGMKKLVQVSMALGSSAPVILLDEPFAFISEEKSFELKSIINKTQGKIILITSHEIIQNFSEYIDISKYQLRNV
ncbi:MAG: ATP-binding cassette domain-containing protein [Thaumarchaeota archaeon]|jgi:ABC-type multidrug transport system ATPase subunit|nr:ATP-binding cassette domain-containing protein [Nitrososphaerota archaeon]